VGAGGRAARERRSRRGARLAALALVAGLLALTELGLRLAGFGYPPVEVPLVISHRGDEDAALLSGAGLHRADLQALWLPREGAEIPWAPGEHVSADGYRREGPRADAEPRVLALGDSSTFGYGVGERETWSYRLERMLADEEPGRVQVLDGGIVGSTIVQGIARYRMLRERWRPQVVVAAFGAINEQWPAWHGLPDEAKIAEMQRRRGRLSTFRRWLRRELRLAHAADWLVERARGGLRAEIERTAARMRAEDAEHAAYLEDPDYVARVPPDAFEAKLDELLEIAHADGGALVVIQMPRRPAEEELRWSLAAYDEALALFAERTGVPRVDVRALFRAELEAGRPFEELMLDAYHPSPAGQRMIAEALAPVVRRALEGPAGQER